MLRALRRWNTLKDSRGRVRASSDVDPMTMEVDPLLLGRNPVLDDVPVDTRNRGRQKIAETARYRARRNLRLPIRPPRWHSVDTNPLKRCNAPADCMSVRGAVGCTLSSTIYHNDYSDTTWQTRYDL